MKRYFSKRLLLLTLLIMLAFGVGLLLERLTQNGKMLLSQPGPAKRVLAGQPLPEIPGFAYPQWFTENEVVYEDQNRIVSFDLRTKQTRDLLPTFPNIVNLLLAKNGRLFIQTSAPFAEEKQSYMFQDGKINEINLTKYGVTGAFAFFPSGNQLSFIGLINLAANTGHLYVYDLITHQVNGPLLREVSGETTLWFSDQRGFVYSFNDAGGVEKISLLTLNPLTFTPVTLFAENVTPPIVSPDRSQAVFAGETALNLLNLTTIAPPRRLLPGRYSVGWVDEVNLLVIPKNQPITLQLIGAETQITEDLLVPTELNGKTAVFLSPSPSGNQFLLRTGDHQWYLLDISPLRQ